MSPKQSPEVKAARQQLIEGLNEDLSREYQAIISYVVYSQVLKGAQYMSIAAELEKHAGEELQHALLVSKQIDYLGGDPVVTPKPVRTSTDPKAMLRFDLENETETVRNYRERVRQCEALEEYAMAEVIRDILVQEQEHQIDLATALGIEVPDSSRLAASERRPATQRARAIGARTRVLFLTDGENNPWAQRAVERRWRISPADRLRWGSRRRAEAVSALSCLGLEPECARFLGYPDQGLFDLLMTEPEPLIKDLVQELTGFEPSILIEPDPADRHPDHAALGVLATFALARASLDGLEPTRLRYLVHDARRFPSHPAQIALRLSES